MKRLTEAFEREKREYYESLTSVNPEDIAKEKAEMEAAEEKVKKFSVTATKDQLSKDEKKLQTKENALKEARTRLANAQEDGYDAAHIEKLQQAVAAAKDARDEAKKRVADAKDAFFRASEEAFNISDFNQKIEDSEQGVKSRGTFSSAQALMMSAEDSTQEKQIVLTETLVRQLSAVGYNINQIRALVEDANFGRLE